MTPGSFTVTVIERLHSGMLIFRLAVVQFAEQIFLVKPAGGDGMLLIIARFRHHVGEAGGLYGVEEQFGVFERKEAKTFLYETLLKKRGSFKSCKKEELIRIFLESGMDLAGVVPPEILAVPSLEEDEV